MIIKSIIADQLYSVSSILEKICYVSFIGICNQTECLFSVYINGDCTSQAAGAKLHMFLFYYIHIFAQPDPSGIKTESLFFPFQRQLQNPFSQHKAYGLQERITAITSPFLTNAYQYLC